MNERSIAIVASSLHFFIYIFFSSGIKIIVEYFRWPLEDSSKMWNHLQHIFTIPHTESACALAYPKNRQAIHKCHRSHNNPHILKLRRTACYNLCALVYVCKMLLFSRIYFFFLLHFFIYLLNNMNAFKVNNQTTNKTFM